VVKNAEKNPSAAGDPPRTPLGELTAHPQTAGEGTGGNSPRTSLLSALRASPLLFPTPNLYPSVPPPHLMQAGDVPESHIGYD